MAKLRGPLMSMTARGQFAKSQVYSSWRGIAYARMLVTPGNPRTVAQTLTRTVFSHLNAVYRSLGTSGILPWTLYTIGRPMIPRNGFIKINLPILRAGVSLAGLFVSPGARGGPALLDATAVPGGTPGEITWTLTPGAMPDGWSMKTAHAVAIPNIDPHEPFVGPIVEQTVDNPGPFTGDLAGCQVATSYLVSLFAEYTRPDNSSAVSPSVNIVSMSL